MAAQSINPTCNANQNSATYGKNIYLLMESLGRAKIAKRHEHGSHGHTTAASQFENYSVRMCRRELLHQQNYSLSCSSFATNIETTHNTGGPINQPNLSCQLKHWQKRQEPVLRHGEPWPCKICKQTWTTWNTCPENSCQRHLSLKTILLASARDISCIDKTTLWKLSSCAKHFILHAEKAVQQSNCSCKPYISNVNANMKAHHDGKWSHLSLKTTVFACAEEKNPASTKLLSVIVILRHSFPLCKRYMYEFASH